MTTALFIQRGPARLSAAMFVSVLFHAVLLSVAFSGSIYGLPGLNLPWKERRLGADDLRITLAPAVSKAPAPVPAQPDPLPAPMPAAAPVALDPPLAASTLPPVTLPPPAPVRSGAAAVVIPAPAPAPAPAEMPVMPTVRRPDVNLPVAPAAPKARPPSASDSPNIPVQTVEMPLPAKSNEAAREQLELARLEQEQQAVEKLRQAEQLANAQREVARQEQLRQDAIRAEQTARTEAARMEAARQELAQQDALRRDALRQEQAKQVAKAQQEAARQELERAETARDEAARREAAKQEETRQAQLESARQAQLEAARQDATRQEKARQAQLEAERQAQAQARVEAARQDALKQEAARQDAIRQEAARQDAAKQDAAQQEQARQQLAQKERAEREAKRQEGLRALGEQMKKEAAERDALNRPSNMQPTVSTLRRGWMFGRADANADLELYAQAMSKKIETSMSFDMVREAVKQPHARPTVTVAIRADGSVEKVTFMSSSGVPAIDEAIRKVIASQAPFGVFPPGLARQYDVIEIRRTWIINNDIRLQ